MSLERALEVLSELADEALILGPAYDRNAYARGRSDGFRQAFDAVAALLPERPVYRMDEEGRISLLTADQAAAVFGDLGSQLERDHDRHRTIESDLAEDR